MLQILVSFNEKAAQEGRYGIAGKTMWIDSKLIGRSGLSFREGSKGGGAAIFFLEWEAIPGGGGGRIYLPINIQSNIVADYP